LNSLFKNKNSCPLHALVVVEVGFKILNVFFKWLRWVDVVYLCLEEGDSWLSSSESLSCFVWLFCESN